MVGFEKPYLLLLLIGLLPLIWAISWRSLAGLGRLRQFLAILFRTAVCTALVFALAEIQWEKTTDQLTVIYLLDQSESIPLEKRNLMLKYVFDSANRHRRTKDSHRPETDLTGVIVFGATAKVESPPYDGELPEIDRIEGGTGLRVDATNLEAALKLAKATFPESAARRVVVVSDGNENIGNALAMAATMAADGIGIDVVPVDLIARAEVSVDKILVPVDVRRGQKFESTVVLTNDKSSVGNESAETRGTLRLLKVINQRSELVAEESIVLQPGKNVFSFQNELDQAAIVSFVAEFIPDDPADDLIDKNNRAASFSHVRGKGRVLLIEDGFHPGEFLQLVERLQAAAIDVDVIDTNQLFDSPTELLPYDSIVLANVPRSNTNESGGAVSITDAQIQMLVANCQEFGCGLVMIGGDRAFGAGGWSNTELEKAMPIDFQIKNDKISAVGALAMIMHASEMPEGNFWQVKIAKDAISVLGPMDFCGVVEWRNEGGRPRWLWQLPAGLDRVEGQRERMIALVGRMTPGDMPEFDAPMRTALTGLVNVDAAMKHLIMISDGDPSPPTPRLLQSFRDNKVTISTVAVGCHGPANSQLLRDIAEACGGKYYEARDPRALPKIFQREARRVAKPVIKESPTGMNAIAVAGSSNHEILQGIREAELPPFFGYVMTTVKSNPLVEQLLVASEPAESRENATLVAAWRFGLGRAVAFTSDAGNVWTNRWFASPYYDKLFSQMVRYSMRPVTQDANFTVGTDVKDNRVRVVVTALDKDDDFINFLNIQGRAADPSLQGFDLSFTQAAPGRYVAEFDVGQSGNYLFSLFPGEGYERLTAGVNVPYSAEYLDREANLNLLQALAELTPPGGKPGQIVDASFSVSAWDQLMQLNPFRSSGLRTYTIDAMWPWILVLAASVFFLDVLIRRIAIGFEWVFHFARWIRSRLSGQELVMAQASIDRLRSRKQQVSQQLEASRAATRFAPPESVPDRASGQQRLDQVLQEEQRQEVEPLPPKPVTNIDRAKTDSDYTARLLKAKRQAKRDKQEE